MTWVYMPPCIDCKNRYRANGTICCGAYPDGIPDDILEERIDPRTLPECGNGYRFEDKRNIDSDHQS